MDEDIKIHIAWLGHDIHTYNHNIDKFRHDYVPSETVSTSIPNHKLQMTSSPISSLPCSVRCFLISTSLPHSSSIALETLSFAFSENLFFYLPPPFRSTYRFPLFSLVGRFHTRFVTVCICNRLLALLCLHDLLLPRSFLPSRGSHHIIVSFFIFFSSFQPNLPASIFAGDDYGVHQVAIFPESRREV